MIKPPASSQSLFHAVGLSATSVKYGDTSDVVYHLGGYSLTPTMDSSGPFSYVSCNFSLQQYESGHSRVVTAVTHLLDVPIPNLRVQMSDMLPTSPHSSDRDYNWVDVAEMKLPSPVGDAAVVQKDNGEIWVLGGFKIDYDDKLHLFYQNPVTDVWIYSAEVRSWREGPPLPKNERSCGNKGYTRGTGCILDNGCILYSGGACLRLDNHPYANQASSCPCSERLARTSDAVFNLCRRYTSSWPTPPSLCCLQMRTTGRRCSTFRTLRAPEKTETTRSWQPFQPKSRSRG